MVPGSGRFWAISETTILTIIAITELIYKNIRQGGLISNVLLHVEYLALTMPGDLRMDTETTVEHQIQVEMKQACAQFPRRRISIAKLASVCSPATALRHSKQALPVRAQGEHERSGRGLGQVLGGSPRSRIRIDIRTCLMTCAQPLANIIQPPGVRPKHGPGKPSRLSRGSTGRCPRCQVCTGRS